MIRLVVDLGLPVVYIILLRHRQVRKHGALGIEELNLGATLDEAVCNLQFWFEFPS